MKKQNGITLIALIITIIVMLILVGVTVTVALNGGLFTKAEETANAYSIEEEKELIQVAYSDYTMQKYAEDFDMLETYFLGPKKQGINIDTILVEKEGRIVFDKDGITFDDDDIQIDETYTYIFFAYNNNEYKLTCQMPMTQKLEVSKTMLQINDAVAEEIQNGWKITFNATGNVYKLLENGTIITQGGNLYQKVVEDPDEYIGAKVIGYTANGWDEWKIYDVSSDGFVRIVPANSSYNFVEEYIYDYEKSQEENLAEIQNICNKFINSNLANLAVLPSFEESIAVYHTFDNNSGLYEYDYANETLGVYWGNGHYSMEEIKSNGWTSSNFDVIPLLKLKSNVMVKGGGSKDAGYEIYI